MSKKTSFFLFSVAHPGGFMFTETSERRQELVDEDEWYEHPNEVPKATKASAPTEAYPGPYGNGGGAGENTQHSQTQNTQGATAEPRYTLAEILHSSVSMFSIAQLAGEAQKFNFVLATVSDDGSLTIAKNPDEPAAPPTPPVRSRETPVSYDNEAVAAMILRGNTDPLKHEHFVNLAKLLGVKTHKVKQPDLILQLKAALEGAQPPQQPGGTGEDDTEENEDEVVLGADGKPVAPLKPNTD